MIIDTAQIIRWTWILFAILIPIVVIGFMAWAWYQNKFIFKFNVRIFRTREGGKVKEGNFKGGYINRKNNAPFFQIKTGLFSRINMIETPKVEFMDEEDRLYYKQIDVNTYIQLRREFAENKLIFTPVESDVKYGAILSLHKIKSVLENKSFMEKYGGAITLGIIAITFLLAYMFLLKAKCPAIG